MLAYVFSHRPADGVDVSAYEDSLRRFHLVLASAELDGFIASSTFAVGAGYSDWYLLENSAAMDELNAAAVSGPRAVTHDAVARMATDGVGKLLSLASGAPWFEAGFEVRFGKPARMPYAGFYSELKPWVEEPGVSLWRRMMVLGPPPEFCLITPSRVELPADMHPDVLSRKPI
ncbi:MAG TPA: hypothetical protein VGJ79_06000 [Candidatus Dormibacteraeota bacterium]